MSLIKVEPYAIDTLRGVSPEERQIVQEILVDLAGAADRIKKAGAKWVQLSPKTREKVLDNVPPTWKTFLDRLQRVGEGSLHPQLYAAVGHGSNLLGKLPIEEQDRYLKELIPVAIFKGSRPDTVLMDVESMTAEQRRQVFKTSGRTASIRSIPEQRAWLEAQATRQEKEAELEAGSFTTVNRPGRWKAEGGKIWIHPDKLKSGLTQRDVALMLKDLTA